MPVRNLLLFCCTLLALTSCEEAQLSTTREVTLDLPATRYNYNQFTDTTNAISTLGRVLFYDRNLSINNTVACASCHKQSAGFSDNAQFSVGFEGRLTSRNSMPIQNLGTGSIFSFQSTSSSVFPSGLIDPSTINSTFFPQVPHLFWDGREQLLEELVLQPVGNHIEMGIIDMNKLATKLSALPYYASLFTDAFQSPEVTPDKMAKAISTFCSSINTNDTRFDKLNIGRFDKSLAISSNSSLNALELEGMMLFSDTYDCNSCHQVTSPNGYLFAGTFANIGLDKDYTDVGLQNTTGLRVDAGKFKIPSLRNVAFTAPYMHDGRFATLDDVMEHYSEGIATHPNLDSRLMENGQAKSMNISAHEKQAIIAFLHTLSDESVLTDPKFSNPFKLK